MRCRRSGALRDLSLFYGVFWRSVLIRIPGGVWGCSERLFVCSFSVAAAAVQDIWGVQVVLKHVLCSACTSLGCLWGLDFRAEAAEKLRGRFIRTESV